MTAVDVAKSRRSRLPNRRASLTATAAWPTNGSNFVHVSVGFAPDGAIAEVFARAARPESGIDLVADDAGVLVSLLLQHGVRLRDITHSLGRLPDGNPASVVALVADTALKIEREFAGARR
jgi:hypothetical protein